MCRLPHLHTISPQNNGFPPIIQIADSLVNDAAEVFAGKKTWKVQMHCDAPRANKQTNKQTSPTNDFCLSEVIAVENFHLRNYVSVYSAANRCGNRTEGTSIAPG